MHYNVEPLRNTTDIEDFINVISHTRYGKRNRMIALFGMNTGLRMSDILNLTVSQVRGKDYVLIIEKKTQKKKWLFLKNLKAELTEYTAQMNSTDPLFMSSRTHQAISVNGVYRVFQQAAQTLGREDIGTHTLRKTFGYHYYQQTKDIASLMMLFNHSSEQVTKRYIGIERDMLEQQLANFSIGL